MVASKQPCTVCGSTGNVLQMVLELMESKQIIMRTRTCFRSPTDDRLLAGFQFQQHTVVKLELLYKCQHTCLESGFNAY